jgi:hypothetical protein
MTLEASLFHLLKGMTPGDRGVAFGALDVAGHHIRLRFLPTEGLPPDEVHLRFVTIDAACLGLVVAAEALHPCLIDLSMLFPGDMTDIAVQQSRNVLLVREGDSVNGDLRVLKPSMAFAAL